MRNLLLAILLISSILSADAQNTTEAVLKNGRSVVYYKTNGDFIRELEPEENEYQQYAIAKVMNALSKAAASGYTRADRWSTDIEDVGRSRADDIAYLPVNFKGLVVYQPTSENPVYSDWLQAKQAGSIPDSLKVMIAVDVNIRELNITAFKPFKKQVDSVYNNVWFSEKAELKLPLKMYNYTGPVTTVILGSTSFPITTSTIWNIKGTYLKKGMCANSNIVIRIAAEPEIARQLLSTMNYDKLLEALAFKETWP